MGKGIIGTIRGEMIGGPLDGAKYGDLPGIGEPFTDSVLSCPLGQPADQHPMAIYICRGEAPVAGFWQFFYERTEYPSGLDAEQLAVPDRVESDAGIPEEVAR